MRNFEKKLEEATEQELYFWVNERDFRVVHLASDELTRRSLQKLQESIGENTKQIGDFTRTTTQFNVNTSFQTEKMIRLTRWIVALTIVMVLGLLAQIYLAKIQVEPILSEQQRNQRRAYEFCKGDSKGDWPSASGGRIKCSDILKMLEGKLE